MNMNYALAFMIVGPAGHRYVQMEADILLITFRTGRIIDVISVP